jgi:hypothetical protein
MAAFWPHHRSFPRSATSVEILARGPIRTLLCPCDRHAADTQRPQAEPLNVCPQELVRLQNAGDGGRSCGYKAIPPSRKISVTTLVLMQPMACIFERVVGYW